MITAFNKAVEELGIKTLYEVRERVNDIIQEELGISDVVDKGTDSLCNIISERLNTCHWKKVERGVNSTVLTFEYTFNGKVLNVSVNCYNFADNKIRNGLKNKYPDEYFEEARSSYGNVELSSFKRPIMIKFISINLLMISGTTDIRRLRLCVRHELRHVYEQQMNGDVSFANFKDNTLYMSAADLFNKSQEGTSDKDVGLLGYMSFDYERHSFIEEYFDSVKQLILRIQNGDEDSNALVHFIDNSNPIMDKIVKMRLTLSKLKEGNGTYVSSLNEMLKNTGFTVDKFIKRAEHSINDLLTRYGKCIVKIKDEYPQLFKDRRYSELSYVQNKHRPHPEYYI